MLNPSQPRVVQRPADATRHPPRLLVLDDDAASGRLIGRIAASAGFQPVVTETAESFHAALAEAPPDVIVLDLQLGTTDGVEQVRYLATQRYNQSLILISGLSSRILHTVRELAAKLNLTVSGTFTKPLEVGELRPLLERLRAPATDEFSAEHLKQAIQAQEIVLEYQPIVASPTHSVSRLEALARWHHPRLGLVEPDRFLPLLDKHTELADALTDWSLGQVVQDYRRLVEQGITLPIAVNLPANCVLDLSLPDELERRLKLGGMPPDHLCLEITENQAFQDPVRSMDILSRLRLKGMHLAIDDFGTGYSSLRLLRQMPFSMIKIDRSFVLDMETSHDSRAIVTSVIDLAHNMDLECVAEGVETRSTAALLESLEVDFLQGYLIARAMPPDHLPGWLPAWRHRRNTTLPTASDAEVAFRKPATQREAAGIAHLSSRQQDVMRLLAEGCSVKTMARRLGLGIGTVKTHVTQAYAALGAHNRIEALRLAGLSLSPPNQDQC